jgi:hypothetical protein
MFDQVGLMHPQSVTLAPAKERALRMNNSGIVGRGVAIPAMSDGGTHRSVWSKGLAIVSMLFALSFADAQLAIGE